MLAMVKGDRGKYIMQSNDTFCLCGKHCQNVTNQFLERGMDGLFFPRVPIVEGNLLTGEKQKNR